MGLFSNNVDIIDIVASGNIDLVKEALKNGANINKMKRGWTPLLVAISSNNLQMARFLLSLGALTIYGVPLLLACANRNKEAVQLLLEYRTNPNQPDMKAWFPIIVAAQNGDNEIIELSLRRYSA